MPDFLLDDECYFINLPIFKSHTSMVFSCALKNLKGVVQDKHHVVMHTTNLAGAVADLGTVIQPDLTIVDMVGSRLRMRLETKQFMEWLKRQTRS